MDWIDVAQDKNMWRAFVYALKINLRFPYNERGGGEFLNS